MSFHGWQTVAPAPFSQSSNSAVVCRGAIYTWQLSNGNIWMATQEVDRSLRFTNVGVLARTLGAGSAGTNTMVSFRDEYLYMVGGIPSSGVSSASVEVYRIGSDGIPVLKWLTALPLTSGNPTAFVVDDHLIVTGVGSTTVLPAAAVYSAKIGGDGSLGPWILQPSTPVGVRVNAFAQFGRNIFLIAGVDSGGVVQTGIQVGHVGPDGSLYWSRLSDLAATRRQHMSVIVDQQVLVISGLRTTGGAKIADVEVIQVDGAGDPGPGVLVAELAIPAPVASSSCVVLNDCDYSFCGTNAAGAATNVVQALRFR